MIWTAAYVSGVVLVNVIFGRLPYPWSVFVGSVIVGGIFILRDFSQREIGDRVLWAMLAGLALSYVMAAPSVAVASALAFGVSAVADYLVIRCSRRPFRERVILSSVVSVPIDSVVFLLVIGALGPAALLVQIASKFAALAFLLPARSGVDA